jgi:hypothetical protein
VFLDAELQHRIRSAVARAAHRPIAIRTGNTFESAACDEHRLERTEGELALPSEGPWAKCTSSGFVDSNGGVALLVQPPRR